MLNLRQLNQSGATESVYQFSQFSAPDFRVPSHLLGNIGESLDHTRSNSLYFNDNETAWDSEDKPEGHGIGLNTSEASS